MSATVIRELISATQFRSSAYERFHYVAETFPACWALRLWCFRSPAAIGITRQFSSGCRLSIVLYRHTLAHSASRKNEAMMFLETIETIGSRRLQTLPLHCAALWRVTLNIRQIELGLSLPFAKLLWTCVSFRCNCFYYYLSACVIHPSSCHNNNKLIDWLTLCFLHAFVSKCLGIQQQCYL